MKWVLLEWIRDWPNLAEFYRDSPNQIDSVANSKLAEIDCYIINCQDDNYYFHHAALFASANSIKWIFPIALSDFALIIFSAYGRSSWTDWNMTWPANPWTLSSVGYSGKPQWECICDWRRDMMQSETPESDATRMSGSRPESAFPWQVWVTVGTAVPFLRTRRGRFEKKTLHVKYPLWWIDNDHDKPERISADGWWHQVPLVMQWWSVPTFSEGVFVVSGRTAL